MATAKLNGTLTDDGGLPCDVCFAWTVGGPTYYTAWQTPFYTGMAFSETVLVPSGNVTVYFMAIARNAVGTTYGAIMSFVTPGEPPDVITLDASVIGEHDAQLNGQIVNDRGGGCQTKFQYGGTSNYGNETQWVSGAVTGSTFYDIVGPLSGGKSYHYRAVARNKYGEGYGQDVTFTTLSGEGSRSDLYGDLLPIIMG